MGKKKIKDSENEESSGGKLRTANHGTTSGKIIKPVQDKRPGTKCTTVLISVILVAAVSFFLGLILIELNVSNKDLEEDLLNYHSNSEKQIQDKVPNTGEELRKDTISEKPLPTTGSETPENLKMNSRKDSASDDAPPPKKSKQERDAPVRGGQFDKDVKAEAAAKLSEEKIREIEKQIVTEEPPTPKESPKKHTSKPVEVKTPTKPADTEKIRKKEPRDGDPSPTPSPKKMKEERKTLPKDESTVKEDESGVTIETLYLEVESLAEEIRKKEPENEMVKQLAPHLKGVLKSLEDGKMSGLKDSLIHIKSILLDLKERLSQSNTKPVDTSGKKDDDNRVPVEEVIPDPVYIAPRGDKEKSGDYQQQAAESGSKFKDDKPQPVKVSEEVKPKRSTGKEIPQAVKDSPEKVKREASQDKKDSDQIHQKEKVAAAKVSETNIEKDKEARTTPKVEKPKQKESPEKNIPLSKKISEKVKQNEEALKKDPPVEVTPEEVKLKETEEGKAPQEGIITEKVTPTAEKKVPQKEKVTEKVKSSESVEKKAPQVEKSHEQVKLKENVVEKEIPVEGKGPEQAKTKESGEKKTPQSGKVAEEEKPKESAGKKTQSEIDKEMGTGKVLPKEKVNEASGKAEQKIAKTKSQNVPDSPSEAQNTKPSTHQEKEAVSKATSSAPPSRPSQPQHQTGSEKRETTRSEADDRFEAKLKSAESLVEEKHLEALTIYEQLLQEKVDEPRVLLQKAKVLANLAQIEKSNKRLEKAILTYSHIINLANQTAKLVPKDILREAALECADKMEFRGWYGNGVEMLERVLDHFSDDITFLNKIGIFYLIINKNSRAKEFFEKVLEISPENAIAMAHYGFILKIDSDTPEEYRKAIDYLTRGIKSGEEKVVSDSRFYHQVGDALQRLGENERAYELYDIAAERGLFLSRYQRSLYNVDGLRSQPVWTPEETTYEAFFRKLESQWEKIAEEGKNILLLNKGSFDNTGGGYRAESEKLRETGDWGIFELYVRGKKKVDNCKRAPITCSLIDSFPPAAGCTRGQTKFSVMTPGTHVYTHTGPTNCRLRAHLGLVTPKGARMRVVNQTLEWNAGKIFIFDDSFEHEVWHEGEDVRLILIVDVWHPELTLEQKKRLRPI